MTRTVAFATLGCRLNQVDGHEMQAALSAKGFRPVPFGEPADVVVVNTCTVTARADFSDRQTIQRAVRGNPRARLVVTGCWAQTDPETVARVRGVDLVVGNADKARLPEMVADLLDGRTTSRVRVSDIGAARTLAPAPLAEVERSRAFVKVQDGCQHRCAFCIVPQARGASRSREPEAVLDQVRWLVEAGHAEVVLTGVDLGHYGFDLTPRTTLAALVRAMVEIRGLRFVRLSSVLPAYFTSELLDIVTGSSVIAPHLHVPLQSGSDRVLRRMRRPYTVAMYRALVERLATAIPDLGLGTDVIVGFPGETDVDFEATQALVSALPFTYLHVFGYSDRRATEAVRLDGHLEPRVITARSRTLRALGGTKGLMFRRRLVGTVHDVVVLDRSDRTTGTLVGLTGNYVEVTFDGPDTFRRRLARVRITGIEGEKARGELT